MTVAVGGRVRVLRPRAPFDATVERVNLTSVTVRADNGKRWRVKLTYPMKVLKVGRGPGRVTTSFGAPPRARASTRGTPRTRARTPGEMPGGSGSVPQTGKAALAWMKALAASMPRDGRHFLDKGGGDGFSGWLWAQVGTKKDIILSTNGEHSGKTIARLQAEIRKAIPGSSTWVSYD